MNFSYFEIGGHIVCLESTSLPSPQFNVSVVERPERGRNSTKTEGAHAVSKQLAAGPEMLTIRDWLEIDPHLNPSKRDQWMHEMRAMRSVIP